MTPLPSLPAIDQIGNYDVLKKIASGGMGEVFLARQRGPSAFSRHVVLKRLHGEFSNDPHFVGMFLNEAQIVANISHPNITHIYELFEDGENGFVIAMEYVRGGTVLTLMREHSRVNKGGLPLGAVIRISSAVCEALHYAYFEPGPTGEPRHVIHRDVSPSNVLCGYDGQVKLVDFGIAKAMTEATQATSLKGKYGYMSPEQIKSLPLDHRTDLFSLGTMMWEMLVGKRLFKRDSDMQMLYAIIDDPIPRPSERLDTIPPALDAIVMKALARSRDDRYQNALEIAHDLRAVAKDNDWDVEASTFSRVVRQLVPEDALASTGSGSGSGKQGAEANKRGSDSGSGPRRPMVPAHESGTRRASRPSLRPATQATITQAGAETEVEDLQVVIEEPSGARAVGEQKLTHVQTSGSGLVIAILVLVVISSAVFWIAIAPNL